MLRFYRHVVGRLKELEDKADKDFADLQDMDRLQKVISDEDEPTYLARLTSAWRGTLTTSGDQIWDAWMENVRTGNIPDEWWGPLKDGVKG